MATISLTAGLASVSGPAASAADAVLRMTVYPNSVTSSSGAIWQGRTGFDKGDFYDGSPSAEIKNTTDDVLYRPEFVRMSSWSKSLENGQYEVTLKMREDWWTAAGQRVFDVTAEGRTALRNIDIVREVGRLTAYDRSFIVDVTDGQLNLGFVAKKDAPTVSALMVRRLSIPAPSTSTPPPTSQTTVTAPVSPPVATAVHRMTVEPAAIKDSSGNVYTARSGFDGGDYSPTYGSSVDIAGTVDDALYRAELVRMRSWSRSIANGAYDVTLKMREGWWTRAGVRVFDVSAEGEIKLRDVDIFREVGQQTAYDRSFRVHVRDGVLNLSFTAKKDAPLVSAIVVTRVGAATSGSTTSTSSGSATSSPPTTTNPEASGSATSGRMTATGRLFGTPRSGKSWMSGSWVGGAYMDAARADAWGAFRGSRSDLVTTYPERDSYQKIADSDWHITTFNGFRGRLLYGLPIIPNDRSGSFASVTRGDHDWVWRKIASDLVANGRDDSIIRIGWEANGDWWPWNVTASTAPGYKASFRRIVQVMRSIAPKLVFDFDIGCGTGLRGASGRLDALTMLYPGDDVVDLVGCDTYDWWQTKATDAASWARSIAPAKSPGLADIANFARAHKKGMSIPEWGLAKPGNAGNGDNPFYIRQMYAFFAANKDVLAVESYFNEPEDYIRNSLWSPNQNPLSSAEYVRLW